MMKKIKEQKAITLVALVVTIIVLIILAGISISLVLGENGIITKAKEAKDKFLNASEDEEIKLNQLYSDMQVPKGPTGKPLVNKDTITTTSHEKIVGEDALGNQVVVPDGFKVASDSGATVKVGIVIEDAEGNQYVWVPVSNINHDGSNKIKVNSVNEEGVEITLERCRFDKTTGEPLLIEGKYQYANTFDTPVVMSDVFQELTTYRESNGLRDTTGTNTTARGVMENDSYNGIKGFIESVDENKGYYIARYEASYRENGKAGSKVSTSSQETLAMTSVQSSRTVGDLWNLVKQGEAATACYDLYPGKVNSDLMNSYAWDTAIIYIQAMENENYANANRGSNTTLMNTGTTGDEKCKIFDMAGNEYEWTTENTTDVNSSYAYPCVNEGGSYEREDCYTATRWTRNATTSPRYISFRVTLYL